MVWVVGEGGAARRPNEAVRPNGVIRLDAAWSR